MRKFFLLLLAAFAAACSSDDDGPGGVPLSSCTNDGQKQFVLDAMRQWYFWEDRLPADVDITQFVGPDDLLAYLASFSPDDGSGQPVDRFSFINTAEADQQFFGEGRFEGFGFSSRFVATDDLRLTRVLTDSPANRGGLARGQRILQLNDRTIAEIQAAEGVNAVFDAPTLDFTMRETDGSEFTVTITQDIVTIDPVPQFRVIDAGGGRNVGYIELATFISTANSEMNDVFGQFLVFGLELLVPDLGGIVAHPFGIARIRGSVYLDSNIHEAPVLF